MQPIPTVDTEKFKFCVAAAFASSTGLDPQFKFNVRPVQTDNPFNRFFLGLSRQCQSKEEAQAMGVRTICLLRIFEQARKNKKVWNKYFRENPVTKTPEVHETALALAATFPVDEDEGFDTVRFFDSLTKTKRAE